MPLIILGIIVVVGAGLMIYYQIGPTVRTRIKTQSGSTSSPVKSDSESSFGGFIDLEPDVDFEDEAIEDDDDDDGERKSYGKSSDGKVLYIFDAGKTELRPLNEEEEEIETGEEEEDSDE